MDLVQLEHFLAVVAERTFTRAAERVSRTQPAVSQSIKRLEDAIGTPLFARDAHDVTLTEAGRLLAAHARRIVALRDDALRQIAQLATLRAGTVSIAAHESAAVYLLPAALHGYLGQFPGIKVALYRNPVSEIPRQVMDREVDIGFVREAPAFRELRLTEVHLDHMVLIVTPDHPLASRTNVRIDDLAGGPFVVHSQCAATANTMHQVSEKYAVKLRVAAELWSFENIKGFVREGVGVGIVPLVTVRDDLRAGTLARIAMPPFEIPRRTLMIHREQGYLSECASELIKMLQTFEWGALPPSRRPTHSSAPRRVARASAPPATSRRPVRAR